MSSLQLAEIGGRIAGRVGSLMILLAAALSGCGSEQQDSVKSSAQKPSIVVTSWPLFAMADRLAGDAADVELVVPPATISPNWKPSGKSIRQMQAASRILVSGSGFEPWMRRITLPESRVVDTGAGYRDAVIRVPDAVIHQHGPGGRHSHAGDIWATWLDPELAIAQLDQVETTLAELLPDVSDTIHRSAESLDGSLRAADARLQAIARSTADAGIVVVGDAPVYQYLTRRLDWQLEYIHLPPRGPLSEEQQLELQEAIGEQASPLVFIRRTRWDVVAEVRNHVDARFVKIDLCLTESDESLAGRLNRNLENIEEAIVGIVPSSSDDGR